MSLVAHAIAGSSDGINVIAGPLNTTAATLLVAFTCDADGSARVNDSYGNVWIPLTPQVTPVFVCTVRMHYVENPIVGPGHSFSAVGVNPTLGVQAHSGVIALAPFDAESGLASTDSLITPPALTPQFDGTLFVSCYTTAVSFARGEPAFPYTMPDWLLPGAHNYPFSTAYYEQVSAAAQSVTWAPAGAVSPPGAAVLAIFKTRSISAIPLPTPPAPQIQCAPQSSVSNGGKGAAGCNTGGIGWTRSYPGPFGTVPQHDEPASGETLTGKDDKGIEAWFELRHIDYPSGDEQVYVRAMVPLDDDPDYEQGYKPDGLLAIGDVEHALANEQGGIEAATVDISVTDARDRLFRRLLDDQELEGDEIAVKLGTDAGRAAGTPPMTLMRAVVQKPRLETTLRGSVTAVDQVFSDFGPFGPDAKSPYFTYGDLGAGAPQMTPDTKATPIVPLYGEKSDIGATDPVTNVPRSKGLIGGTYLGKFLVTGLAVPTPTTGKTLAQVVAELQASVDAGTTDADWADLGGGYGIGTEDAAKLQALGTVPDTYDRLAAVIGYADLDGLLSRGTTAAPVDNEWGIVSFGLGEWYQFLKVHGSDLGGGDPQRQHDRTELDIAARAGGDLLVPGDGTCPWTAFVVINPATGRVFELAAIGVRGPLLDDHVNGVVNLAASAIGIVDNDGLPIVKAFDVWQHWLENMVFARKTCGPWVTNATAPAWRDGTFKVNSASFAACQAISAAELGGDGLLASWYPDTQQGVTEWLATLQAWTGADYGTNNHGQSIVSYLDPAVDTSAWPRLHHVTDVFGPVSWTAGEPRENVVIGVCDWDSDASKFRNGQFAVTSPSSIEKYKGKEKAGAVVENAFLADEDQLEWVLRRRLARRQLGTKQLEVTVPIGWLDYPVGSGLLYTSEDGPGVNGYVDAPMIIRRRRYNFASRMVTLTLQDVRDVLLATRFAGGLDRLSTLTDDADAAVLVTDDEDLAALVLL